MFKTAFMIMPFNNKDANEIYEHVIKKVCSDLNIEIKRVDENKTSTSITKEIFELIENSDLIIVDLSKSPIEENENIYSWNANVFWEFGYAFSLKKNNIILIINKEDFVNFPFDIKDLRVFPYENSIGKAEDFKTTLKDVIKETLKISQEVKVNNKHNNIQRVPEIYVRFPNKKDTFELNKNEFEDEILVSYELKKIGIGYLYTDYDKVIELSGRNLYPIKFLYGNFGTNTAHNSKIEITIPNNIELLKEKEKIIKKHPFIMSSFNITHIIPEFTEELENNTIHLWDKKLLHNKKWYETKTYYLYFENNEPKDFEIKYTIFCEELPELITGILKIKFVD
ncbi:hypothetical protein LN42_01815 [Marinitoga sp. 1137]|uniref:hypothetical protein n=1 Tax=Marinitoga sp. 1137 TaxID=1545835 RepID=UPI000950AFCA|nr:hypothetical protein [Marinitoga sp. 1137]APT75268.1 hypothetical protein LN42_01815 [Marinitoga sp. 1137]